MKWMQTEPVDHLQVLVVIRDDACMVKHVHIVHELKTDPERLFTSTNKRTSNGTCTRNLQTTKGTNSKVRI
jgi:hypothetical protein